VRPVTKSGHAATGGSRVIHGPVGRFGQRDALGLGARDTGGDHLHAERPGAAVFIADRQQSGGNRG
jgi:hypothetical protein